MYPVDSSFWQCKVCADVRVVCWLLAISLETLDIKPALLYRDTKSLVGSLTLNDLEWLFHVKFCFRAGTSSTETATFENNCAKTNKDRPTLSVAQIFNTQQGL